MRSSQALPTLYIDDPLTLFRAYIVGLAHSGQTGGGAILPATHLNPSQTCSVP